MPISTDSPKKTVKKTAVTMATTATPTVIAVPTAQVILPAGLQGNVTVAPPAMKKQKTSGEWRWMDEGIIQLCSYIHLGNAFYSHSTLKST